MPSTGGGGKTATNASWIPPNCWFSAPAMAPADSAPRFRSSNVLSVTNTMPPFDAFTNPLMDRPVNATASSTPGCSSRCRPCADHLVGAVERRRVGQLRKGDQVLLVLRAA